MHIIQPLTITDSMVTTDVAVTETAFVDGAYSTGDLVSYTDNKVYQAAQDIVLGDRLPGTDETYWIEYSATNPWKAFDGLVSDTAYSTTSMEYVVVPGQPITGIALFNAIGTTVNITIESASVGTPLYNNDFSLISTIGVFDWYSYFFGASGASVENISMIDMDLAAYSDVTITITITGVGTVEVGEIVLGTAVDLGYTQKNPSIGIIDFSTKSTDTFGITTVVSRAFSKRLKVTVITLTANINTVSNAMSSIRSTPVVWIALDDVEFASTLLIYGYLKDYNMTIPNPVWGILDLQIEGLT